VAQRDLVLRMLRDAGRRGVTNVAFYEAHVPRFGGRLLELRQAGYSIRTERLWSGNFRYVLTGEPRQLTPLPAKVEPEAELAPPTLFDVSEAASPPTSAITGKPKAA